MKLRADQEEIVKGFDKEQNEKLKMLKNKHDKHLLDYGILEIAIEDKLTEVDTKTVTDFYSAPINELGNIDFIIARLILTLEQNFENVKENYFDKMVLDPSKPEIAYLTELVKELI